MAGDYKYPFGSVWVSHSSMGDFLKCPRLYYLNNVYKDPKTGRKISLTSPALSLGSAVHETIEPLAFIPAEKRLGQNLEEIFAGEWAKVSGKQGGFKTGEQEAEAKARGLEMVRRVMNHPGPIARPALRLAKDREDLPSFMLDEKEKIILCGKIDWLEYLPKSDSLHVIDFKTGKYDEDEESLQLPIYLLLLKALKPERPVGKASYWYLDRDDEPKEKTLPSYDESREKVLAVARRVAAARAKGEYDCPNGESGCRYCRPLEAILRGEAEYLGKGKYGKDIYLV
jgi:CRISPR/Cas system-associated exonuclease Cas4 (RecB family)